MPTPSAPPTAAPVASAAPVVPVTKAWHRPGDVIASSGGVALDSGVLVSLSGTAADSGQALLCSSVSVDNGSAYEVSYTDQDWTLEWPNGDVQAPDAPATAEAINQDQLLPGDRVSGEVCLADPGQAGLYVFGFQPHPASVVTPGRIVWLVTLP